MIRDYCSNTDCENKNLKEKLHKIELRDEFGSNICYWCLDCLVRDYDMIERVD